MNPIHEAWKATLRAQAPDDVTGANRRDRMEQKAAHTPGPWQIEWNVAQGGEGHYITDSKDMAELSRIAAVLFHDDADGETRANARLIAAAPDLLAALVTAELLLADICVYGEPPELANIRDAIAKAEGGAA